MLGEQNETLQQEQTRRSEERMTRGRHERTRSREKPWRSRDQERPVKLAQQRSVSDGRRFTKKTRADMRQGCRCSREKSAS